MDADNANLASVTVDGVSLTYDAANKIYSGTGTDLQSALMTLVPENLDATITVNGQPYTEAFKQGFSRGSNRFEIVVTALDGTTSATYTFSIENKTSSTEGGGGDGGTGTRPTYPPTVEEPENGTVTTSPSRPKEGDRVTITPKPDEGFEVDEVVVEDANGNEIEVTQNQDGTYSFTQPDGKVTITVTFRCDGGELCPGHHLTDVSKDAWYHAAVDYVVEHGIMEGMSATTFSPNTEVTRAQAVQILYNLEGQPDISDENLGYPYEDVNAEEWYGNAVYWARITGVATGYGDGTFQPGDSITRQEFAQMLYNYAKYKGYDLTAAGDLSQFPDSNTVADWAEAAMSWANGNELINGHDNGTIDPTGTTIRAQAASILMRFDLNLVQQ